eukprot:8743032-Pyramimonas_sp.AAC.1
MLCPTNAQITCPPLSPAGAIVPSRAVAVHVHYKIKGGCIAISAYLWVDELFGPTNIRLLTEIASYIHRVQATGYEWVLGGDFNMNPALLQTWAASIGGAIVSTTTPTCTQTILGTVIDFVVMSANMAIRTSAPE